MNESILNLLERALAMRTSGRRGAACLVVRARGSTPQTTGALMLVDEDLNTFGTIGGGCVEAEVRRRAHELFMNNDFAGGLLSFKLDHDYGWDDGLICGGTIELAVAPLPGEQELQRAIDDVRARRATTLTFDIESTRSVNERNATRAGSLRDPGRAGRTERAVFTLHLPPRDRLYIAGAGHVGQALARLALPLEFETTLFDDRADLLQRFAPAGCAQVDGDIAEQLRAAPIDDRTFIVVVTRGHKHDEQALHAAIGRGAAYVGMIGSRRKIKLIFDDLKAMGVQPSILADVHAPIGIDIGSVTVEEIALSIAAELVQARRSRPTTAVSMSHDSMACAPDDAVGDDRAERNLLPALGAP